MIRRSDQLRFPLIVLLTAVVGIAVGGSVFAQDKAENDPAIVAAQQSDDSSSSEEAVEKSIVDVSSHEGESEEARTARRQKFDDQEIEKANIRKSALAGLLVLSLICIVFLVLIVLVALWARRIRMLTRQPMPEHRPGDPLWYLRKGKGSDSPDIAEVTDGGSSHGES